MERFGQGTWTEVTLTSLDLDLRQLLDDYQIARLRDWNSDRRTFYITRRVCDDF